MTMIHAIRWVVRMVIFVLIVVLVLDNMKRVQFNFYGIYDLQLPLILLCLLFLLLGAVMGVSFGFIKTCGLKLKLRALHKQLKTPETN